MSRKRIQWTTALEEDLEAIYEEVCSNGKGQRGEEVLKERNNLDPTDPSTTSALMQKLTRIRAAKKKWSGAHDAGPSGSSAGESVHGVRDTSDDADESAGNSDDESDDGEDDDLPSRPELQEGLRMALEQCLEQPLHAREAKRAKWMKRDLQLLERVDEALEGIWVELGDKSL